MNPKLIREAAEPPHSSPLVTVQNVHKSYRHGHEQVDALRGIDLEIVAGSFVVIIGPSGGGKSTFLHLVGGLDGPTSGTLCVNDVALEQADEKRRTQFRRDNIGFVFQSYNLVASLTALDNVLLPLLANRWRWRDARARAAEVLAEVGLSHRERHKPGELSGGEQQRVAIARAIIGRPSLLIADEPTGDLDTANAEIVLDLMAALNRRQAVTCIVATHDLQVAKYATHLLEMRDGRLYPKTA